MQRLDTNLAARWADYSGSGNAARKRAACRGSWTISSACVRPVRATFVRPTARDRFDQTRGELHGDGPREEPADDGVGTSFSGGNPDVKPEKRRHHDGGLRVPGRRSSRASRPRWTGTTSRSTTPSRSSALQNLVDGCVRGDSFLCQFVIRATNGDIVEIDSLFINLNEQHIEGVDIEFDYRKRLELLGGGPEQISARLFGTYLMHNSIQSPNGPVDEVAGQVNGAAVGGNTIGGPKWKISAILGYSNGPYSATLIGRYIGDGILDRTLTESDVAIPG